MTFALYTETFQIGSCTDRHTGIGRYCRDLAIGLAEIGQKVTVLTGDQAAARQTESTQFEVLFGPPPPASLSARSARARWLARQLDALRPDVLLIGDPLAHDVMTSSYLWRSLDYSVIVYGSELSSYASLARHRLNPRKQLRRWLYAQYMGRARNRVCISRYCASELARVAPDSTGPVLVYPCVGVQYLTQQRSSGATPDGTIRFVTVGRISERKNQLGVLTRLLALHQTDGIDFHYTIVGNVDDERHRPYCDRIRDFVQTHDIGPRVDIVSGASDAAVISILDTSDIFVMLSQPVGNSVEGFGISAIEAAAREMPALVSSVGGMSETVEDGVTGFVIRMDEPEEFRRAVLQLRSDPRLRRSMGRAGRERVISRFTPRAAGEALLAGFGMPRVSQC